MSQLQNLLQHAVSMDGNVLPPPSELEPYEFTDVPNQFDRVRGFGGATSYKVTALDCGFSVTCKPTDLTYSFLAALNIRKNAQAFAGADPTFTIVWSRADIGEVWTGLGCTFQTIPGAISKETPTAVTWTFNVGEVVITAPASAPQGI